MQLTDPLPVDPTQLERQANTIAELRVQRDFIARQAQEERERWHSERENWDRTAEALISQRNRPEKSEVFLPFFFLAFWCNLSVIIQDVDRLRTTYETENKALRDKVCVTQHFRYE